jgi:DNA-directed RNA polymerase subunit alpha
MLETNVALPSKPRVVSEEGFGGVYEIDGLYPGYGHTLGNSLRRILLSSPHGAAITQVKIEGVQHEFSALDGIKEDVLTIVLNLKRVRLKMHSDEPLTMSLKVSRAGIVTASAITAPGQIEILNPDQYIAEITAKGTLLELEMLVERGLGYVPREVHQKEKVDVGTVALDAVFTPIRRVNYEVENMRVGDQTDYNRLRIFIETDGSLAPRQALERSIEIMIHQLKAIIGFQEKSTEEAEKEDSRETVKEDSASVDTKNDIDVLKTRIETVDLSSRTAHALEEANIRTIGGLVRKKKDDILAIEGIGPKGLREIEEVLGTMHVSLKE